MKKNINLSRREDVTFYLDNSSIHALKRNDARFRTRTLAHKPTRTNVLAVIVALREAFVNEVSTEKVRIRMNYHFSNLFMSLLLRVFFYVFYHLEFVFFVRVLWHINVCRLFDTKSIFIQINSSISNNSI